MTIVTLVSGCGNAYPGVNDASWRIDVEPAQADWDAPHHRETLAA
jgi:hypothetical protein